LVVLRERRHLQRDARRRRAGEDLEALADEVFAGRDRFGRIAASSRSVTTILWPAAMPVPWVA
jgi:hypothetical protein